MGRLDNITDFSARDSKAFDESTRLFEEAGVESSKELRCFADNIYNRSGIVTKIKPKTRNAKNFLDEDFQAHRKMNENTSAIQELTEALMYGSTEEDLEMEITEGGVADEVAEVFARHGITGNAVKDTFKKLETYYGKEPNMANMADFANNEEDEVEDDSDMGPSEEDLTDEAEDEESLEEKYSKANDLLRKVEATKNLKKRFSESKKRSLKEALLVAPTGSFSAKTKRGVKFVGISDEESLQDSQKRSLKESEAKGKYTIIYEDEDRDRHIVRTSAANDFDVFIKMHQHDLGELGSSCYMDLVDGKLVDNFHDKTYETAEDVIEFLNGWNGCDTEVFILNIKRPDGTILFNYDVEDYDDDDYDDRWGDRD